MPTTGHSICQGCGATIYPEHLDSGIARYEGGKLMCKHCVEEYEASRDRKHGKTGYQYAPIEFDEKAAAAEDDAHELNQSSGSTIAFATSRIGAAVAHDPSRFKRPTDPADRNATRCRIFHCKLNDGALDYMANVINEWLDAHPQISIKFANSCIGAFEGKSSVEQNLIVTVYY